MSRPTSAGRRGNEDIARQRVHGTHGEVVAVRAERDRGALLALPAVAYLVVERTRRVARDGMFSFEGRRYQVPGARGGETIELVLGATEIEVRDRDSAKLVCRHERGRPLRVLPDPAADSVSLASVLGALPVADVHTRPLSAYEELIGRG